MASRRPSLEKIGRKYRSDKFVGHDYADFYEKLFNPIRDLPIRLLEIGIGEEDREIGGASLLTWAEYFQNAEIVGIDLFDKTALETDRIRTRICDQSSHEDLETLCNEFGSFDVIIDDGSHIGQHITRSLFTLFPYLSAGGLYILEDLQTSYWPGYGGSSLALQGYDTGIRWTKFAIDIINRPEILFDDFYPLTSGFEIQELVAQHNIAALRKLKGPAPTSLVLSDDIREKYRQEDQRINGTRQAAHTEMLANPEKLGRLLEQVTWAGGIEEAIRRLSFFNQWEQKA